MSAAERAYRLLLRAYPAEFRAAYGREMLLVFRDQHREAEAAGGAPVRFWAELLRDVARSAPALRLEAWRGRSAGDFQLVEGTMKTMAILAVLVGAVETLGAASEGWGGRLTGGGAWMAGVALMILAGLLLLAAGVAMLRRSPGAPTLARAAAVGCLAAVVLVRVMQPWMSIFSMLLGIAFPVALLVYLGTRGRGTRAPTMA